MGCHIVIEFLTFETGFIMGKEVIKYSILKGELLFLTIGIKIDIGF